jgi:hypothetical protein
LQQAIAEHRDTIAAETLADELVTEGSARVEGYAKDVNIDGAELAIAISKK